MDMTREMKNRVMKKVRAIFLLRRLAAPFVVFSALAVIIASAVSVSNVIANMPDIVNIQAVMKFFLAAFAHTDFAIKSALVAGLISLVLILKGLIEGRRLSLTLQKAS